MSDYIKMYFAEDDTLVSPEGVFANSVDLTLRADLEETDEVRLYAKAEAGYSVADVEVIPVGTTASKWALAPDVAGSPATSGTYEADGEKIELGTVTTTPVYFWARAKATQDEDPVNDVTVTLKLEGIASAV